MAFWICLGVALFLLLWSTTKCEPIPEGVAHMKCHDRYFMIAVDLSFAGEEPHFDAVDETGVYPITKQHAAQCGYSLVPLLGHLELRASYFSCHTDNKDDKVFMFNFNLKVRRDGQDVTYTLNKTCSPSVPWSPREVTCETNYMEVTVRSELGCPSATKDEDWSTLKAVHGSSTSDWQVMFHRAEEKLPPLNLSEACKQGYVFFLTDGRLVFRTPYGQPYSFSTEVNGVPVEVVHATLFSRQSWVVVMVDLVAACSTFEGLYDHSGYIVWKTPETLYPSLDSTPIHVGLGGELVAQPAAARRGYVVEQHNATVQISIHYNAEEGHRKSFVTGDLYEFYTFDLHLEQILVDEDQVETRVRFHRTLATPLLPHPVFTDNHTVLEERMFTAYLGDIPGDVDLTAVWLNGHTFSVPFTNTSMHTITKVVRANSTHGYTLKVPFDHPAVIYKFSKEDAVLQYELHVNFTLTVLPENEPFYHLTSIIASFTDVSPPVFDAVCSESGISFRLDHRPFDYLWDIRIGSDLLTAELAVQHGYILSNDSQSLLLDVPLFSPGYKYENLTLKGFFATFEILIRDHETSEIQSSTAKTCRFNSTEELIVCSTDGWMTVVADVSLVVPSGGSPAGTSVRAKHCGPKEADHNRALFSFPVNACGSSITLDEENVTYHNEIVYSQKHLNTASDGGSETVTVRCTYPLAALHRLFSVFRFQSDAVGVGSIIHSGPSAAALQEPVNRPRAAHVRTPAAKRLVRAPHRASRIQHLAAA